MNRNTWKQHERDIAADLAGKRIPVTGVDRDGADVLTPLFAVQVKVRRSLPAWLWGWLSGICSVATNGRVGVLVLRRPREKKSDGLVVLRYEDFVALHGRLELGDIRRNSQGDVLGPRVKDDRSYDEKQAPKRAL